MREPDIHDRARGRWDTILKQLGVEIPRQSNGRPKNGPCPACQNGTDRFVFTDRDGSGSWICRACGGKDGSGGGGGGIDLVMRVKSVDFLGAVRLIEPLIASAPVVIPKAAARSAPDGKAMWARSMLVSAHDPVAKYLAKRGLTFETCPSQIRFMERARYVHEDARVEHFPAMIGNFASPCRSWTTAHITFLDYEGNKANVQIGRKFYPGKIPEGGAIRLAPSAETMGIAEGIETALSASALFGIPVWATCTAIGVTKWEPPPTAKNIIVFGDHDRSFTGHSVAYWLAKKLRTTKKYGLDIVEVRIPDDEGTDWNDVLLAKQGEA